MGARGTTTDTIMQIELSNKELEVVLAALDTYTRVHLGQASQVMEPVVYSGIRSDGRQFTVKETLETRKRLEDIDAILTGIPNGGPSLFNKLVSNRARIAYRLGARLNGDTLRMSLVDENGNPTS